MKNGMSRDSSFPLATACLVMNARFGVISVFDMLIPVLAEVSIKAGGVQRNLGGVSGMLFSDYSKYCRQVPRLPTITFRLYTRSSPARLLPTGLGQQTSDGGMATFEGFPCFKISS